MQNSNAEMNSSTAQRCMQAAQIYSVKLWEMYSEGAAD